MKICNYIVNAVYAVAGMAVAFFFMAAWATKMDMGVAAEYVSERISTFGLIGTCMILLGIVWIVNRVDQAYRSKEVSFDNPNGKIKISLRAIENYINSMLIKQIKDIHSIKVKTDISSRGLNTNINLKLFSHFNIPELCTQIQEVTKNYLQDAIGIERVGNIEIFISRIKSNGDKEENESPAEPAKETAGTESVEKPES